MLEPRTHLRFTMTALIIAASNYELQTPVPQIHSVESSWSDRYFSLDIIFILEHLPLSFVHVRSARLQKLLELLVFVTFSVALKPWRALFCFIYFFHSVVPLKDAPKDGSCSESEEEPFGCSLRVFVCFCSSLLQHWLRTCCCVPWTWLEFLWIFCSGALSWQYALVSLIGYLFTHGSL